MKVTTKRIICLLLAIVLLGGLCGCGHVFGVREALESAERAGDTARKETTFKSSVTMIFKAKSYEYSTFALYDKKNETLGIVARGDKADDLTVVYIPDVKTMLSGDAAIGYDLYYLALLGEIEENGRATAVLFATDENSMPTVIAQTTFTVPKAILEKVKELDIYNKTLPCPVYDIAAAEEVYGTPKATDTNIATLKGAKKVSDLSFKE